MLKGTKNGNYYRKVGLDLKHSLGIGATFFF
jgi:hypothetical protein